MQELERETLYPNLQQQAPLNQPFAAPATWWDISKSHQMDERMEKAIAELFQEQPLDENQSMLLKQVQGSLMRAALLIESGLPPSHDRDEAIQKLREVYSSCRSAIAFRGRY